MTDDERQLLRDAFDVITDLEEDGDNLSYEELVDLHQKALDVTERILATGVYPERTNPLTIFPTPEFMRDVPREPEAITPTRNAHFGTWKDDA